MLDYTQMFALLTYNYIRDIVPDYGIVIIVGTLRRAIPFDWDYNVTVKETAESGASC